MAARKIYVDGVLVDLSFGYRSGAYFLHCEDDKVRPVSQWDYDATLGYTGEHFLCSVDLSVLDKS